MESRLTELSYVGDLPPGVSVADRMIADHPYFDLMRIIKEAEDQDLAAGRVASSTKSLDVINGLCETQPESGVPSGSKKYLLLQGMVLECFSEEIRASLTRQFEQNGVIFPEDEVNAVFDGNSAAIRAVNLQAIDPTLAQPLNDFITASTTRAEGIRRREMLHAQTEFARELDKREKQLSRRGRISFSVAVAAVTSAVVVCVTGGLHQPIDGMVAESTVGATLGGISFVTHAGGDWFSHRRAQKIIANAVVDLEVID